MRSPCGPRENPYVRGPVDVLAKLPFLTVNPLPDGRGSDTAVLKAHALLSYDRKGVVNGLNFASTSAAPDTSTPKSISKDKAWEAF